MRSEGCPMVNDWKADAAPPGFWTVTVAVPGEATREAGTAADNWVELAKAVGSACPFHCTADPGTKFVPTTVRVKAGSPEFAVAGVSEVIVGVLIVNFNEVEIGAPGFCTVTLAEPGEAIRLASISAVTWVELTNPVASVAPFHNTADPPTKPLPFTVSWNAGPPATDEVGFRPESVGEGGTPIVNSSGEDVAPPG